MEAEIALLRAKWAKLCELLAVDDVVADRVLVDLVERYGEDGRYYHNLTHIHRVLQHVEMLQELTTEHTAVQLAAWFHDAIYHIQLPASAPSNEEQSAAYAAQTLLTMQIPDETIALISRLICSTQLNSQVPDDPNFHVLLDADLAILASDYGEYEEYARAIRREFAFVPDEAYRNGRRQVLQSILDRERIFLTDKMFHEKESHARHNIQLELDTLAAQTSS